MALSCIYPLKLNNITAKSKYKKGTQNKVKTMIGKLKCTELLYLRTTHKPSTYTLSLNVQSDGYVACHSGKATRLIYRTYCAANSVEGK